MILAHRIALDPTPAQAAFFCRSYGVARFAWNWALAAWMTAYKAGEKVTANSLNRKWNATYHTDFPWVEEVGANTHQRPFSSLSAAWSAFFAAKKAGRRAPLPRFKKKGRSRDAYYVANCHFRLDGSKIRLPKVGWVRMRESLRFAGKVVSAVVSRTAGRHYVSVTVDVGSEYRRECVAGRAEAVGVDVGLTTAVTLSTGEKVDAPRPLRRLSRKLKRLERSVSRKKSGSSNRRKAVGRLGQLHAHIACVRRDFWHKVSTRLLRENQAVVVEDLNVAGMVRNRHMARSLFDTGFGVLKFMLRYKAPLFGAECLVVDRWFPSTKKCCSCGVVCSEMRLYVREFHCEACGAVEDRDVNAAKNLRTAGLAGNYACGVARLVEAHVEAGTSGKRDRLSTSLESSLTMDIEGAR